MNLSIGIQLIMQEEQIIQSFNKCNPHTKKNGLSLGVFLLLSAHGDLYELIVAQGGGPISHGIPLLELS